MKKVTLRAEIAIILAGAGAIAVVVVASNLLDWWPVVAAPVVVAFFIFEFWLIDWHYKALRR